MSKNRKHIYFWVAILILAVGLGGFLVKKRFWPAETVSPKAERVLVEAAKVEKKPFVKEINAVGTLVANDSIILRPEIDGIISDIFFQSGSPIPSDTLMYRLDDSLAKAQLREANANMHKASKDYERAKALAKNKFISQKEQEKLFADLEVAISQKEVASSRLQKTELRSPFSGTAGLIEHSRGAYVRAGEDLVNVVDLSVMKIDFRVGEEHLNALAVGQELFISVDGFPDSFKGEIEAIDPKIDTQGHSISIRARVENTGNQLRPGLFGSIRLVLGRDENTILIPEAAIETKGGSPFVYRVVEGVADATPITVAGYENGFAYISDGLFSMDTVITAGGMKISSGVPIEVVESKTNNKQTKANTSNRSRGKKASGSLSSKDVGSRSSSSVFSQTIMQGASNSPSLGLSSSATGVK